MSTITMVSLLTLLWSPQALTTTPHAGTTLAPNAAFPDQPERAEKPTTQGNESNQAEKTPDQNAKAETKSDGDWVSVDAPFADRYGVDLVWCSKPQRLFFYGGMTNVFEEDSRMPAYRHFRDLWLYDPVANKWKELFPKGESPGERGRYAACYDAQHNGVWLHGGSRGGHFFDDLWFFDLEKEKWQQVEADTGPTPFRRREHTLVHDPRGNQLLMFGGLLTDFQTQTSNELWAFDLATREWKRLKTGPSSRFLFGSAFEADGRRLYVIGGLTKNATKVPPSLWVYDAALDSWDERTAIGMPRMFGNSLVFLPRLNGLMGFGGEVKHKESNSETWYDLIKLEWTAATSPTPLAPRTAQGMEAAPESNQVFIFGGLDSSFFGKTLPAKLWMKTYRQAPEGEVVKPSDPAEPTEPTEPEKTETPDN
jgi:N-acetylneuraminic acid mutarotase